VDPPPENAPASMALLSPFTCLVSVTVPSFTAGLPVVRSALQGHLRVEPVLSYRPNSPAAGVFFRCLNLGYVRPFCELFAPPPTIPLLEFASFCAGRYKRG